MRLGVPILIKMSTKSNCKICNRKYTDPRYLRGCLHTFCKECISKNAQNNEKNKPGRLLCPECGKETTVSGGGSVRKMVEDLPVNEFILALTEAESLKEGSVKCGPCERKGKHTMGEEWCTTCYEAMCNDCVGFHSSLKTTMKHELLTISEIKGTPVKDFISNPSCHLHNGEKRVLYCEKHRNLICGLCVSENHKDCKVVTKVNDVVASRHDQYDKLADDLKRHVTTTNAVLEDRHAALTELEDNHKTVREKVLDVRKTIEEIVSRHEKTSLEQLDASYTQHRSRIERSIIETESAKEASSNALDILVQTNENGNDAHIIEWMQILSDRNGSYSRDINKIELKFNRSHIDFAINQTLDEVCRSVKELGKISTYYDKNPIDNSHKTQKQSTKAKFIGTQPIEKRSLKKDKEMKYPPVQDQYHNTNVIKKNLNGKQSADYMFNAKTPSDRNSCWLTGVTNMQPSNSWIFSDRANNKLKLFDEHFQLKSEAFLNESPFDLSYVKGRGIAVSVPGENLISFYKVNYGINYDKSIRTKEKCYGISFADDKFVVTCPFSNPPSVRIIELDGKEINSISTQASGLPMFVRPWYVELEQSGGSFYVSDGNSNQINCLTSSVFRRFKYTHMDMIGPRGFAFNNKGQIYVCGWGSDNIQIIGDNGKFLKELFTRHNGILSPQNLCFSGDYSKFLVTLDLTSCNSDYVQIFNVT